MPTTCQAPLNQQMLLLPSTFDTCGDRLGELQVRKCWSRDEARFPNQRTCLERPLVASPSKRGCPHTHTPTHRRALRAGASQGSGGRLPPHQQFRAGKVLPEAAWPDHWAPALPAGSLGQAAVPKVPCHPLVARRCIHAPGGRPESLECHPHFPSPPLGARPLVGPGTGWAASAPMEPAI